MIYRDWAAANTGIFYQMNSVEPLPFTNDTITIEYLDQDFLLENANKEMYSSDTDTIVRSILASYFIHWQNLTTFYKSIEPGTTSEIVSTSDNKTQNNSKVALSDTSDMFTTGGNDLNSTGQTSTKTKNIFEYKDFLLSSNFYDIIKMQLRDFLFINVY